MSYHVISYHIMSRHVVSCPVRGLFPVLCRGGEQMGFIGTNMFMMAFTSYFFEGFVLVRVPFPLTNRFKVCVW